MRRERREGREKVSQRGAEKRGGTQRRTENGGEMGVVLDKVGESASGGGGD